MTDLTADAKRETVTGLSQAVHRNSLFSADGLRERLFTFVFRGLVYPQIWEDPLVDMQALQIQPGEHIAAIASGGCNVMSYLTADPGRITAIDLNHAHIALNKLKITAARTLSSHREFSEFFADADRKSNTDLFDSVISDALDPVTRHYWTSRDIFGRRRITSFARGFYRTGLLGRFIGAGHKLGRTLGMDARKLMAARTIDEQRQIFDDHVAPVFENRIMKAILNNPASLYGLGIPPSQYEALANDGGAGIAGVVRSRLETLACGFPLRDNYFAWQAFARRYDPAPDGSRPPYLEPANFEAVRERASRITVRHISMTDFLARNGEQSVDCYVLLDAQDWMDDDQLTSLWREIDRTATRGARVIFRTAADEPLLPGRIPAEILDNWSYRAERSRELHLQDRSSIYGAFHLYKKSV